LEQTRRQGRQAAVGVVAGERGRAGVILICFQVEPNNPWPCGDTFHSSGV
jgi:hypothetical protein